MSDSWRAPHIVVANGLDGRGRAIARILREGGYEHVSYVAGGAEVVTLCSNMWVDVLVLDLGMPDMDGVEVLEQLQPAVRRGLQVLVVSGCDGSEERGRAFELGARDVVSNPEDPGEVLLRMRNALQTSALEAELSARDEELAQAASARSEELARARREVLTRLAVAADCRDDQTGEHTERVGRTSAALAAAYGFQGESVRLIESAAPLHDVGKLAIPDSILLKNGPLSPDERQAMQAHTTIGAAILADSEVPELRLAETIALCHHERWDGAGYPNGLQGLKIPIAARIVALADVFDALVSPRPYKEAWPLDRAVAEIRAQRSRQFDPHLAECFLGLDLRPLMPRRTGRTRHPAAPLLVPARLRGQDPPLMAGRPPDRPQAAA